MASFGGWVEFDVPMHPEGDLKWSVAHPRRVFEQSSPDDPRFRRSSRIGEARGYRDACELRVEVLRDLGQDVSYRPIVIWADDTVRILGPRRGNAGSTVKSESMPRDVFLETHGDKLSQFLHLGTSVPPGVQRDLLTFGALQAHRTFYVGRGVVY